MTVRVELPPMRPMDLDPTYVPYLSQVLASRDVPIHLDDPAARRARMAATRRAGAVSTPVGVRVSHHLVGVVPVRVYHPADRDEEALPGIVYIHGGGWMYGSAEQSEPIAARYCRTVGAVVVSADYRLTPEHPFPAGLDDCRAVLRWFVDRSEELGLDPARLAVAGESSGANLAAACALWARDEWARDEGARDEGAPALCLQVLNYPALGVDFDTASYRDNAAAPVLSRDEMVYFWQQYLRDTASWSDPLAAPLLAPDLAGVAPAFVSTAEYDPLRDDGGMYVDRLRAAGVPVTHIRAERLPHGFLRAWPVSEDVAAIGDAICDAFCRAFAT